MYYATVQHKTAQPTKGICEGPVMRLKNDDSIQFNQRYA
jgi:hypothetical protein